MNLSKEHKILIVGLGLLGGSYAMALSKKGYYVSGIARREATVEYALENGLIKDGASVPDPSLVSEADIVFFALSISPAY